MRYGLQLLSLALVTALICPVVLAAERQPVPDGDEQADSPTQRTAPVAELTYAGRSLATWQTLSLNDLDSATRAQAFSAFAMFAHRGRMAESRDAITSALSKEKSLTVLKRGYKAARGLGEDGLSILVDGLRHKNQQHRRAAIEAFDDFNIFYMGAVSDDAVTALTDILRSSDTKMRMLAIEAIVNMAFVTEIDDNFVDIRRRLGRRPPGEYGPTMQRIVSARIEALKDKNPLLRTAAAKGLGKTGRGVPAVTDELVAYLEASVAGLLASDEWDTRYDPHDREVDAAMDALDMMRPGPGVSEAIPVLKKLAEREERYRRSVEEFIQAINADP